jgi:LCP family protein required for cell wall assembly
MDSLRRRPPIQKSNPNIDTRRPYPKPTPSILKTQKLVNEDIFTTKRKRSSSAKKYSKIIKRIFFIFLSIFLSVTIIVGGFFIFKLNNFSKNISADEITSTKTPLLETISDISKIAREERTPLKGEQENRINILLLGMAGKGKPGGELTDTIMIASIDTKNNKVALLSLPRDLHVTVPEEKYSAKINSLYKYGLSNEKGIEPLRKTIEEITDLSINYHLIVDFSGFEKFIDDIGGINVSVERDIYDSAYPGPNYSYETFELKKGFHTLDGATALKYARERHDDPEGDFGRAKRQQQVIQAAKNKIFSTKTFLNPFAISNMLDTLGENIRTDISLEEIDSFLKLTKNLDTQNINNAVVDAWKEDSLLKVSHILYENTRAFILVPRIGNYGEIQDLAKNIFDLKILERRKIEIKSENPTIGLINATDSYSTYSKLEKLIKKGLGFENVQRINIKLDTPSEKTTLFNLTNQKPFSTDELIKKVPATINATPFPLTEKLATENIDYDIIIILGKDLNEIYHYDEDSLEDLQKSEANQEILIK